MNAFQSKGVRHPVVCPVGNELFDAAASEKPIEYFKALLRVLQRQNYGMEQVFVALQPMASQRGPRIAPR